MTSFNQQDLELLHKCGITTDTILTAVEYGAEPIKPQITANDFYSHLMASMFGFRPNGGTNDSKGE